MNKSDITSKEYLLAEIDDLADEFSEIDENGLHSERWCGIMDAKQIIINTPFVSDRPQGEWISNHDGSWNCSECGLRVLIYAKGNYCPNCGADMGGEKDETD